MIVILMFSSSIKGQRVPIGGRAIMIPSSLKGLFGTMYNMTQKKDLINIKYLIQTKTVKSSLI